MLFNRSNMRDNDQSYLISASESLKFNYYRAKGHLFRYLGNRIKWHMYPRLHVLPSFPDHVDRDMQCVQYALPDVLYHHKGV